MSAFRRILIVDDHKPLRGLLSFLLASAGYDVGEAADGAGASDELRRQAPHLVLLDWRLPDTDGVALLQRWRHEPATAGMPVVMMSGESGESDRVAGLRAGADDYLVKPFGKDELLARVEAVLRRATERAGGTGTAPGFPDIVIDTRSLRVTARGRPVHLGPIELRMLNLFVGNPDRVFSRRQIVDQVWRANAHVDPRTVDVHVRRLRNALAESGLARCLQTVRGAGYRLSAPTPRDHEDAPPTA